MTEAELEKQTEAVADLTHRVDGLQNCTAEAMSLCVLVLEDQADEQAYRRSCGEYFWEKTASHQRE